MNVLYIVDNYRLENLFSCFSTLPIPTIQNVINTYLELGLELAQMCVNQEKDDLSHLMSNPPWDDVGSFCRSIKGIVGISPCRLWGRL